MTSKNSVLLGIEKLLRNPLQFVDSEGDANDQSQRARFLVMIILVAGALFGAALGCGRGGWQVLLAAVKLPLVTLLTAAICAPCLTAFNYALERPANLRRDISLVLAVLAIGTLTAFAMLPVILLGICYHAGYHGQILIAVVCCAIGGMVALRHLSTGIGGAPRRGYVSFALICMFALVGSQMTWTLRPFVVRPRSGVVVFRSLESSFMDSVITSSRSAAGIYDEPREWREPGKIEPLPSSTGSDHAGY